MDISLKNFFADLKDLLINEPPYWIFLFISTLFVSISLLAGHYFKEMWAFFLYSVIGTFWRHIDKDLKLGRWIYQIVNILLLVGLFLYLDYL
jgi:hypothetical protein